MPTSVFSIDRTLFASRDAMVETIKFHIATGSFVQVEDGTRPRDDRLLYEIRPMMGAVQAINASGRLLGIFADLEALVAHAEVLAVT